MRRQSRWLPSLLLCAWLSLFVTAPTLAQSPTSTLAASTDTPAPPTSTPTAPPSPAPALLVIQATPVPSPAPQGSLWQQVWAENQKAILLGFITVIIASILVGVFLRQIAETLSRGAGRLFHFLFDRFASAPLLRLRFDKTYRKTLAAALQKLASSNIVDREVRLDKVYVPVGLTEATQAGTTSSRAAIGDLIEYDDDRRRRQAEAALEPWEAIRRYHRLVVLGQPGAGKTTYLTHLAFMCARREKLPDHTPIFLRLRDLKNVTGIAEMLPDEFARRGFPNARGYIGRQLAAGHCLILLDGLDEVDSPAEHRRVIGLVQAFADQHVPDGAAQGAVGNVIVVSCRTHSYEHEEQLTGFTKTMVMDFDDPAIERFIHNWFGSGELGLLAPELLALLNGNRRFKELARNPLLLLLIADHYRRDRNLPAVRADLYKNCIDTRIIRWNTVRGTHRGRFGESDKWRLLRELALDVYRQQWSDLLEREDLVTWVEKFAAGLRLPEGVTPADLLDEVARDSGLLQERAIGRYGFSHLTLQEYFAAGAIDKLGPDAGVALLGEHLADARWQEVVALYSGLTDHAGPLLRRILGETETRGKAAWLQAGRCLAEGAKDVPDRVCRQAADGLLALLRRTEAGERDALTAEESAQAVDWLVAFAADRLPGFVRTLLAAQTSSDAVLAARLLAELPAGTEPALRAAVSRRMAELARSEDANERRLATAAMGWVASLEPEAVRTLRASLADPAPAARAEAARALGRLAARDDTTAEALRRVYAEDPADAPRHAALEALLALGRHADMGMVLVPAGEFLMGSADDDREAESDEKPQHRIYLPAYALDRTPVTNAQYRRFIAAGGYANPAYWKEASAAGRWKDGAYLDYYDNNKPRSQPVYWGDAKWNSDQQPVVGVSWYEALAYLRWAGKRLPTEAEWEKAATWTGVREQESGDRSQGAGSREPGRKLRYPWGDAWDPKKCNTEESGIQKTTPVGNYSPALHPELVEGGDSPCGAADMAGNVFEWCSTRWGFRYPYAPDDGREDLGGGDSVGRVVRGGSWYNNRKWARGASRYWFTPWDWYYFGGFRGCCSTSSLVGGSGF